MLKMVINYIHITSTLKEKPDVRHTYYQPPSPAFPAALFGRSTQPGKQVWTSPTLSSNTNNRTVLSHIRIPAMWSFEGTPRDTTRKPLLLFLLSGLLLLRLADRQLSALLFQLPPRLTRFEPLSTCSPFHTVETITLFYNFVRGKFWGWKPPE